MLLLKNERTRADNESAFSSAVITAVNRERTLYHIKMDDNISDVAVQARSALAGNSRLREGDHVLTVCDKAGACYIIGVLNQPKVRLAGEKTLTTNDGASVSVDNDHGAEEITVRNRRGKILFTYHPEKEKCTVCVPEGDLEFLSTSGNIDLLAGKNVRIKSKDGILMEGEKKISMHTNGSASLRQSALVLDESQARLTGHKVSMKAALGEFALARTILRSSRLSAKIDRARVCFDHLETLAGTINQKTQYMYQQVDRLLQINSGRMRTFIQSLFHLKAKRTYLKAEQDMKLKGEKIHLR
jgi:hypothetical protein